MALYSPVEANQGLNDGQPSGVIIIDLSDATSKVVTEDFVMPLGWSPDDSHIFYLEGNSIFSMVSSGGDSHIVLALDSTVWKRSHVAMSRNARQFASAQWNFLTDVWLMENFDPDVK